MGAEGAGPGGTAPEEPKPPRAHSAWRSCVSCVSVSRLGFAIFMALVVLVWIGISLGIWVTLVTAEDDELKHEVERSCSSAMSNLDLVLQHLTTTVSNLAGMDYSREGQLTDEEFARWTEHIEQAANSDELGSRLFTASYVLMALSKRFGAGEREFYEAQVFEKTGHGFTDVECPSSAECGDIVDADANDDAVEYDVVLFQSVSDFDTGDVTGVVGLNLAPLELNGEEDCCVSMLSGASNPGVYMGCDGYEFGSFCIVTNVTRGLSVVSEEFESSVHVTAWDLEADVCVLNCDTGLEPYGEQFPMDEYQTSQQGGWRNRNYLLTQGLLYGDRQFGLMCERESSENIANNQFPVVLLIVTLLLGVVMVVVLAMLMGFIDHTNQLGMRLRRVTKERTKAKEDAVAADIAKSSFLACMSHEIRTPLNGILGSVHLFRNSGAGHVSESQARELGQMEQCGDTLLCMVDDILDYCKIEAQRVTIQLSPAIFCEVVESAIRVVKPKAVAKNVSVTFTVDPSVPECFYLDRLRLRQVLLNLLANAVKFTAALGSVEFAASFQNCAREGETPARGVLQCEVRDTGVGIPAEALGRIFVAFEQGDQSSTRRFGGSGLGLAISKSLVELMGGGLSVSSVEGEGSVFKFDLPITEAPPEMALGYTGLDVTDEVTSSILASIKITPHAPAHVDDTIDCMSDLGAFPRDRTPSPAPVQKEESPYVGVEARAGAGKDSTGSPSQLGTAIAAASSSLERTPVPSAETLENLPDSRRHALIVDDNAINKRVASRMLERAKVRCSLAANGKEAVELALRERFDIIFMDCHMPVMDGYEAAMAIRDPANPNCDTPIVALSADAFEDNVERCRECGMVDFLPKPLKPARLKEILETYCPEK